jgi:hypothetical protein
VTRRSQPADDDSPWRRPAGEPAASAPQRPGTQPIPDHSPRAYQGPPPTNPPPAGWRPPVVAQPASPRRLPEQDHARLDVEEKAAKTLTTGIGMLVGAVLLVLILILCARGLF